MGESWKEVMQLLLVGITIEVVGSVLALLLWNFILKWCRHPPSRPLLPLTHAVGESADQLLTNANAADHVEMEDLNVAEVVASEAVPTTPNPANAAPCLRA